VKILLVSKAMRVALTASKAEGLGRAADLTLAVPTHWPGFVDEPLPAPRGYQRRELPVILSGRNHLHVYRGVSRLMDVVRPDLVHVDEEHYSLVTFQIARAARRRGTPFVAFTWQNIARRYPPPFAWTERWVLRHASAMLCGNADAAEALRWKGCEGATPVIPQFGLDPRSYDQRASNRRRWRLPEGAYLVGFVGRVILAKGLDTVIEAAVRVPGAEVVVAGSGPDQARLEALGRRMGVRVHWLGPLASGDVPELLASVDVLTLPSRTTATWKEQFGRVLVEAMAQGTALVGSDSGEIPNVVGDAGVIVPEGDVAAWADALTRLGDDQVRSRYAQVGVRRARRYAQERIVADTLSVYRSVLGG